MRTMYFNSTSMICGYPGYPERSGQKVEIIDQLHGTDEREVGAMFRVRFADGAETDVFEEELSDSCPTRP